MIEMQMESTPNVVEAPVTPRWSAATRIAFSRRRDRRFFAACERDDF